MFAVATYNVWFGSNGAGEPYPEARMKALVNALMDKHLDEKSPTLVAIGFQEVIPATAAILQAELNKHGYELLKQPTDSYGCALAVLVRRNKSQEDVPELVESGWMSFGNKNTSMNRGFLWARLKWPTSQQEVLFTTTHLESPIDFEGRTNRVERIVQIRRLASFCEEELQKHPNLVTAIISGDLNWDEQVKGAGRLLSSLDNPTAWTDAWLETHDETEPGYTFDSVHNPFLKKDRQGRLDRILVHNSTRLIPAESFLTGQDAIPGYSITKDNAWTTPTDGFSTPTRTTRQCPILPSDHFGVVVRMQWNDGEQG